MTLQQDIIHIFWKVGWAQSHSWVYYTAITKVLNDKYFKERRPLKKGSTVERIVRYLKEDGVLEGDNRGNFRWKQPKSALQKIEESFGEFEAVKV